MEIGKKYVGSVRRIVDFGAFIDLGGIDGLAHISEISWGRVKKVSDVLKEGDRVEVSVIDFDREKGKISLTLRDVKNDPWLNAAGKFPIGQIVTGKVARLAPFGAFVELEDGIDGLVHISQISNKRIAKPDDVLEVGQIVNVKITDVDPETKRVSLSIKEAEAELEFEAYEASRAKSEAAETEPSNDDAPDGNQPDADLPDENQPDAGLPDGNQPDAGLPDEDQPESGNLYE
jgi:4-hydroxy-3-methylbut-2-enyl diphosphate reductase